MAQADVIFRGNASSLERSATAGAAAVTRVEQAGKRVGPVMVGASKEVDTFGKRVRGIAGLTLGTLGAAELVKGVKESINAAGDLEKQQRKVIRVFGDTPKVLEAFEKTAAKAYGVSHLAALKAATSTGALLTNLGVGPKAAAGFSVGIIKLSSDIASFNNLPTAVVADRVNKALLGQTRGLKSLGISLSQTDVNAKALAIGLVKPVKSADTLRSATDKVTVAEQKYGLAVRDHGKSSKEALSAEASLIAANKAHDKAISGITPKLTAQQQALATLALIYERSKKQQGDFARNSDTLANSQKTLDAEFSNLSDRLGKDLTPAMKSLVEFMAGPGISGAGRFLTTVEHDSRSVYDAIRPLVPAAHAVADGFLAIARTQGVIPTILGIGAAYKGTTLLLKTGQSAYLSAAGAIGNLANPFRTVSTAAAEAGNVMVGAGFTGKVVSAASVAEKEAPAFLGLANPIGAIATVAGLAVGGLILLETTTEDAGAKARRAANDFLGLSNAMDKVKSTKLDVTQARIDVGTSQAAIKSFSPTLIGARAAAHQAFPDTAAGDRAEAQAKQVLNGALLRNSQLYLDLARAKARLTQATGDHNKAQGDEAASATAAANAFDGLGKKLLDQERVQGGLGARVNRTAAEIGAQHRAVLDFGVAVDGIIGSTKNLSGAQRAGLTDIRNFVKETGKIPDKKTLSILINDAASSKLNELRAKLALLQNKTLVITERTQTSLGGGGRGHAAGGMIDRPMLSMVGEEAPRYPEFIIPTNPARRGRALDLISQMRSWVPGFDSGGGPKTKGPALFSHEGPDLYGAAYKHNRPYAKKGPYLTKLSTGNEKRFRSWVTQYHVPVDPNETPSDYDMRGYWLSTGGRPYAGHGQHFPDTFKTPYDTTFSDESKYATSNNPFEWRGNNLVDLRTGQLVFGAIKGFAGGGGPGGIPGLLQQEARAVANTPAKAGKSAKGSSRSGAGKKTDNRPTWLKHWQDDLGSKLPGDDAYTNARARAQANLDDASRTTVKSDDAAALRAMIKLANRRLPVLHALRGAHKEAIWQTAVNTGISSVTSDAAGARSTLTDTLHRPGPDDIQVGVPTGITWAIEKAGFSDGLGDDVSAQNRKRRWLEKALRETVGHGKHRRYKLTGAKRTAFVRELARTNAELSSLGVTQTQDATSAADQAAQEAATPPDLPIGVQQALADAALTPGNADDWMALKLEQATLQTQLSQATNPTVQVALKQALAGVNDEISSLESSGSSSGASTAAGPTDDQSAVLSQTQARLALATKNAAVGEQELRTFAGSGDIGTSRFGSALDAARNGPQMVLLGDARSAMAAASWFTQGAALQPSTTSTRLTGVATL